MNELTPEDLGRMAWDKYILTDEKTPNPYEDLSEDFYQWQHGWNQNFNGISKKDVVILKKNDLISKYRLFITLLIENDCIKGVGTIQSAKELLRFEYEKPKKTN